MADASRRDRNLDSLIARAEAGRRGRAGTLGSLQLTAMGVAIIVGAGVFVLTGQVAAEYAGPAVALSFLLGGLAAALAALCYAEIASTIPVTGSTYTFVYAALGPLLGWLVGWNLVLEYLLGAATVAVGWSSYFENALERVDIELPAAIAAGPFDDGVINLPAVLLVVAMAALLLRGVEESARATTVIVGLKLLVLGLFVGFGAFYVTSANYEPFIPANQGGFGEFGASGVIRGAAAVFYAYIGFDIVCNAAQDARDPRRTVPRGVLGALGVATAVYIAVSLVVVGLTSYTTLDVGDPVSTALNAATDLEWLQAAIDLATVIFLAAGVLAVLYGATRVLMRMGEDRLLPDAVGRLNRSGSPYTSTLITAGAIALTAGVFPISTLASLVSAGTLTAFIFVALAVIVLRRRRPDLERSFQLPLGLTIPALTLIVTTAVTLVLPLDTLIRLIVWIALGFVVYLLYGRSRAEAAIEARLRNSEA